jgi:hypothetical protein
MQSTRSTRVSEAGEAAARAFREKHFRQETEAFHRKVEELAGLQRIGAASVDAAKRPPDDVVARAQEIGRKVAEARPARDAKGSRRA